MQLGLFVYDSSSMNHLLADWSSVVESLTYETDANGFASLTADILMPSANAFEFYNNSKFAYLLVTNGPDKVWEGRIEDPEYTSNGLRITGYGYWNATMDVEYTSAWGASDLNRWEIVDESLYSNRHPAKYHTDKDNRIYMSLRKNETYTTSDDVCHMYLAAPDKGERNWVEITFTYAVKLPTDWVFRTSVWVNGVPFTGGVADDTITGNGSTQSGTKTVTLTSGKDIVSFEMYNATGGNYTNTGETDDWYAKITNIQARTTSSNIVYSSEVVQALISYVNGINGSQLSSDTSLVGLLGDSLDDAWYEDEKVGDILRKLAKRGDGSTGHVDVGVWTEQKLHFYPRYSRARWWYVDVADVVRIKGTIDNLYNSSYGVYRNDMGLTKRTSTATDEGSISKYGVTRHHSVKTDTTSGTEAENWRDVSLDDTKDVTPEVEIITSRAYTANGALANIELAKYGDKITILHMQPGAAGVVDKIGTMRVVRTKMDIRRGETPQMTFFAGSETPSLDLLVAQSSKK